MKKLNTVLSNISPAWVVFGIIGSLFFSPISSSLQSIFIVLTLVFVLLKSEYRVQLLPLLTTPWYLCGVGVFVLSIIGCLWSIADYHDELIVMGKYSKLLYLPLFVVAFSEEKTRHLAIHAFLAAMFITCILSFLKVAGVCHYHGEDPGNIFRNHIMTGYMMAFATYLSALYLIKATGGLRYLYMTLILLFSYQVLFIGMGRTSYLTYLLLMTLFVIQVFSWRKLVLALLLVASFVCIIYKESTIMNQRVHEAIQDWQGFHNHTVKDTPVGFRLQFHAYAHTLFNHHPLIGTGTSGFSASFKKDQPVPGWGKKTLFEPHSQYWLMAVDWGLMGLALFISFFVSLLLASWKRVETRAIALGLIASFLMGSFLDSLLLYSGTGYFFLLFMALSLAGGTKTLPTSSIVTLVGDLLHGVLRYKPGRT